MSPSATSEGDANNVCSKAFNSNTALSSFWVYVTVLLAFCFVPALSVFVESLSNLKLVAGTTAAPVSSKIVKYKLLNEFVTTVILA